MNLTQNELLRAAYLRGEIEATWRWAHWHDGVQLVGSCGTTLKDALTPLHLELYGIERKEELLDPTRRLTL